MGKMSRVFGYLVLFAFVITYLVSLSSDISRNITSRRIAHPKSILRSDKYRYGDLYDMSYLPQFKISPTSQSAVPLIKCEVKPMINLYSICDSYILGSLTDKSLYCGVDGFQHAKINTAEKLDINLDAQKINILLLEISERNFRINLRDSGYLSGLIKPRGQEPGPLKRNIPKPSLYHFFEDYFFNKSINTNIELNIWDFFFITPVKEFKASLNAQLFNVVDNNVAISQDNKYLLYTLTTDSTLITSSFQFVPDEEIKSIVENLNQIYTTAKNVGFEEVYLAIIPNPVSILFPEFNGLEYNQLITRVQNAASLKMPVVDIYSTFKETTLPIYRRSDTHWSQDGAYLWLNKFNSMLNQHIRKSAN